MYVEETTPGKFAIQDLNADQLELLMNGLIEVKQNSLKDAETFKVERDSCVDMFQKMDQELMKSKS